MVANKPGNLDGETAVSVWTPPTSDAIVTTARPRTDDAPTAERSAELKEKERQRSKRRRETATAEQREKERQRSARRRNALTPDEKQTQATKRATRRKERKADGTLPSPKRKALALPKPAGALADASGLGTFVEAVADAAGAKGENFVAKGDVARFKPILPAGPLAVKAVGGGGRTPKKTSTEEQRAAEKERSKARRKAMTPDQRKKESQARAERRRRSKQLAANEPGATTE